MTQIEVWNHCLAIGVSDKYPQTYYYISLTDFPSGVNVNYTLVYSGMSQPVCLLFVCYVPVCVSVCLPSCLFVLLSVCMPVCVFESLSAYSVSA